MPNPNPNLDNLKSYKPKWKSGKTRTIRVPVAIADRVLEIAHQIDEGISPDTSDISQKHSSEISSVKSKPNNNRIIDTSDTIREEIENILDEALNRWRSNQGAKTKVKIAELGKYFGWTIEKANKNAPWIISDTSESRPKS